MEELNEIRLFDILEKLGEKNPGNFTHFTKAGEIYAIGKKWKNRGKKAAGHGAISLVMHLLNYEQDKACNWLIREFKDPDHELTTNEGFYWVKCRPGGRWEVAEFDGVAWLSGPEDGGENYITGPRIHEPKH